MASTLFVLSVGAAVSLAQSKEPRKYIATSMPGIQFAEKYGSNCGAPAVYHYHAFKNTGTKQVEFLATLEYQNPDGTKKKSESVHTLDPGKEAGGIGTFLCVMPGTVTLRVEPVPLKRTPAAGKIELDVNCRRLLFSHKERLESAGVAQGLLAVTPLIEVMSGNAAQAAHSIYDTDWQKLAEGIVSINKLTLSALATEALIHSDTHSGETKRFWKRLAETYDASVR